MADGQAVICTQSNFHEAITIILVSLAVTGFTLKWKMLGGGLKAFVGRVRGPAQRISSCYHCIQGAVVRERGVMVWEEERERCGVGRQREVCVFVTV